MKKESFTFNFKRMPKAFLLALVIILFINLFVGLLIKSDSLKWKRALNKVVEQGKRPMLIVGNSRARQNINRQVLADIVFDGNKGNIALMDFPGGMPKAYLFALEAVDYKCCASGGVVVLCATPYELNKYAFVIHERYIKVFFSWKEFFSDLLPNKRMYEIKFFLQNCSFPLLKYNTEIKNILRGKLNQLIKNKNPEELEKKSDKNRKIIRNFVDRKKTEAEIKKFEEKIYVKYTIDDYQVEALFRMIKDLKKKNTKTIIVLLPLSYDLRKVLGRRNLELFVETIYHIAGENKIPVLDYVSSYTGSEYRYYDASHSCPDSARLFSKKFAVDLKKLLEN